MPDLLQTAFLFCVGALAAALNAVAGGGTLIAFPAQLALGATALEANATCSAALWLGGIASAVGYASQLKAIAEPARKLAAPSILGCLVGAWLLAHTSEKTFLNLVPCLVLLATLLLVVQPYLRPSGARLTSSTLLLVGQFLICVYGGYFGAAMGILMIAFFGLFLSANLHQLNALKTLLATAINIVLTGTFAYQGLLSLHTTLAMAVGAALGGYITAKYAQRAKPQHLRRLVIFIGFALSIWFAYRAWYR